MPREREIRFGFRRAVVQDLLRAERPSPRTLEIPVKEREFLRRSWQLLSLLRKALRTEPTVALAVLFGSAARGEMHSESDVDVLVALRRALTHGRLPPDCPNGLAWRAARVA